MKVTVLGQEFSVCCFVEDEESEQDERTSTATYAKRTSFMKMKKNMQNRGIRTRGSIELGTDKGAKLANGSVIVAVANPSIVEFFAKEFDGLDAKIHMIPCFGIAHLEQTLLKNSSADGVLLAPDYLRQAGIVPFVKNKFHMPVYAFGYSKFGPSKMVIENAGVDGWIEGPIVGSDFDDGAFASAIVCMQQKKSSMAMHSLMPMGDSVSGTARMGNSLNGTTGMSNSLNNLGAMGMNSMSPLMNGKDESPTSPGISSHVMNGMQGGQQNSMQHNVGGGLSSPMASGMNPQQGMLANDMLSHQGMVANGRQSSHQAMSANGMQSPWQAMMGNGRQSPQQVMPNGMDSPQQGMMASGMQSPQRGMASGMQSSQQGMMASGMHSPNGMQTPPLQIHPSNMQQQMAMIQQLQSQLQHYQQQPGGSQQPAADGQMMLVDQMRYMRNGQGNM